MSFFKKLIWVTPYLLFALFFCFFSCRGENRWAVSYVKSGDSEFNSSRLIYRSEDKFNGIDLEFLKIKDSINLYLFVHSRPIPYFQNNPKKAKVMIKAEEKNYTFIAFRHEGGQRLLLPDLCKEIIISTLKNGNPVGIQLEGYETKIDSAHFSKYFYKMHYPPKFSSPFHLPF